MRKVSSNHKTLLVHFHDDGQVCPASFGQPCPHGGVDDVEPLSPSFLSQLPNGFSFPPNGLSSFFIGGASPSTADFSDLDSILSNNLSDFSTSAFFDQSAVDYLNFASMPELDVAPNSLALPEDPASSQSIANMASAAISSGSPAAVAAMAKMAAAAGNHVAAQAMAQIAQMAAANGVKTIPPSAVMQIMAKTGLGGKAGLSAAMTAAKQAAATGGNSAEKIVAAQKYQALVAKQSANVQITKTLANSSLAKMSDEEVKIMTDYKFATTKEFISYMQSPDTEIRGKQEQLLKVRNFLPPQAQEPEIFLLEKLVATAADADVKLAKAEQALGNGGFLPSLGSNGPRAYDPDMPEKLRLQEELFRLRSVRKDGEAKKEHLLNRARVLQARAMSHKAKLAGLWEEKLKEEQVKTGPLEEVCAALREALDAEHKKRMEAFETKMKPIIVKDGPSRKANYKIAAAKLYYEIYSLSQRLRLTTIRVEHEEARRERVEREVKKLRDEISVKKTAVTTATKGIPVNKIEVRPQDQQPNYSGPSNMINPMLVGLSNEAQMILASNFHMNSVLGSPSKLPALPGFPSLEFQDGPSPQPPSNNYLIQPRSAKISMEEAAEAANKLASTNNDNSFKSYNEGASASKLPNGRPPQAIQGAI